MFFILLVKAESLSVAPEFSDMASLGSQLALGPMSVGAGITVDCNAHWVFTWMLWISALIKSPSPYESDINV